MTELPIKSRDGHAVREWLRWARLGAAISAATEHGQRFAALGPESCLAFPQGVLHGVEHISIGCGCLVNEHTTLSAGPLAETGSPASRPIIELGDRCVLGRHTEIIAMESVVLEDDVWTAAGGVYITDHNHRHDLLDGTPLARQIPLDVRPVRIGAGSVISTHATILAGAHLGHHTMVAAGAVVRAGHYPPHCVLAGVPARVAATHPCPPGTSGTKAAFPLPT
ncbi:acyltransferase [Amycolatopsis sp. NPDC004378]